MRYSPSVSVGKFSWILASAAILQAVLPGPRLAAQARDSTAPVARGDVLQWHVENDVDHVRLSAELSPATPRLSDGLRLRLELRAPWNYASGELSSPAQWGDFRVASIAVEPPAKAGDTLVRRATVDLEPTKPGLSLLQGISWEYQLERRDAAAPATSAADASTAKSIVLPPREIQVTTSVPADATLDQLQPPVGPLAPPPPPRPRRWPYFVAGLAAIALLASGWRWLRPQPVPIAESAQSWAMRRMDSLPIADPSDERARQALAELSVIVRQFIERATELRAPELTTEEFLREAEGQSLFNSDDRGRLRAFLQQVDLVKFAALNLSLSERARMLESARQFVLGQPGRSP